MTNLLIETLEYFFEHGVTENDIVEVIITYKNNPVKLSWKEFAKAARFIKYDNSYKHQIIDPDLKIVYNDCDGANSILYRTIDNGIEMWDTRKCNEPNMSEFDMKPSYLIERNLHSVWLHDTDALSYLQIHQLD